jgi:hypothetical protein
MITFFTVPKAFMSDAGTIQMNAISSWLALDEDVQVILFGDDDGTAEAARELGVDHIGDVRHNEHGTPLLDGVFATAESSARHPALCFANADIILLTDFKTAAAHVASLRRPFLLVGESWDTDVLPHRFGDGFGESDIRALPGRKRGAGAIDYFHFSKGLYGEIPPFAVGRIAFDNWLVWRARDLGALVVDASRDVHAVHQSHDYGHVAGGFEATRYRSEEGRRNIELAGGKSHFYTRFDATHRLAHGRLRRNWGSKLRVKENARKAVFKIRAAAGRTEHR